MGFELSSWVLKRVQLSYVYFENQSKKIRALGEWTHDCCAVVNASQIYALAR